MSKETNTTWKYEFSPSFSAFRFCFKRSVLALDNVFILRPRKEKDRVHLEKKELFTYTKQQNKKSRKSSLCAPHENTKTPVFHSFFLSVSHSLAHRHSHF